MAPSPRDAMAVLDWFRPPRSVLTLYLAGAGAAVVCVAWLAVLQLRSDDAAEALRTQQRLAAVAERVSARLQQGLHEWRGRPGDRPALPAGAVTVTATLRDSSIDIEHGTLPFAPVVPPDTPYPADLFDAAEAAEFARADLPAAILAYRRLTTSQAAAAVRARAAIGLTRVLRTAGRFVESLEISAAALGAGDLGQVVIAGRPADLLLRLGRGRALDRMGDRERLGREAIALRADLATGRWPIAGPAWEAIFADVSRWVPEALSIPDLDRHLAIASALEQFVGESADHATALPTLIPTSRGPVVILPADQGASRRILLTSGGHLSALWQSIASDASVEVALLDRGGQPLLGRTRGRAELLDSAHTGLPWTIAVADADPGRVRGAAVSRRRTLLLGLAVVALVIVGSGVLTFRGIRRELAIARMHADFVSAASHELRTPITSIRQLAHLLQSGRVASDGRRTQYYDVLVRESERLHRLVERLLKFGRAEGGHFHLERLDARVVASAVAGDFASSAGRDAIDVTTPEAPCPLTADREMVSLALWNLLDNAVKYSPADARVRLDVSATAGHVRLSVADRGVGMAPTDRQRIFEKFVRGADAAPGTSGSGLGLALVDRVVRAHGGRIEVESTPGRGSVFTIVLPMERAS